MGCCGCTNKASTTTAGVFGIIESLIGIILTSYFYSVYASTDIVNLVNSKTVDSAYLVASTYGSTDTIRALLVTSLLFNLVWMISSIALLFGNANDNAGAIRQWVVITSFVIIADIVLPVIMICCTLYLFQDTVDSMTKLGETSYQSSSSNSWNLDNTINHEVAKVRFQFNHYYIFLTMCFSRFGLISLVTNICLTVFANRRVFEIRHPAPANYFFTAVPVNVIQGNVVQAQMQPFPPSQPSQGYFMQQQQGAPQYSHPPPVPLQAQAPSDAEANSFQYAKF